MQGFSLSQKLRAPPPPPLVRPRSGTQQSVGLLTRVQAALEPERQLSSERHTKQQTIAKKDKNKPDKKMGGRRGTPLLRRRAPLTAILACCRPGLASGFPTCPSPRRPTSHRRRTTRVASAALSRILYILRWGAFGALSCFDTERKDQHTVREATDDAESKEGLRPAAAERADPLGGRDDGSAGRRQGEAHRGGWHVKGSH